MPPIFWFATGFVSVIIIVVLFFRVSDWLDERHEKRCWKKRREAFNFVQERLNDCRYWINQQGHEPFKEFYEWIMDKMKTDAHITGEEIRTKVNQIISNHKTPPHDR